MRDLVVFGVIFGSLPFILVRPQVGVMMWVWISVMNPHRLTWGAAYHFGFAEIVAIVTLLSAAMSRDLKPPPLNSLVVCMVLFGAWTGVTTAFSLYPDDSLHMWSVLLKTLVMSLLIPMLFHRKEDLRRLVWVIALSVAYFGTKGGAWTLLRGGTERVYGPPGSYIEDNNALAVAVVMTIPLLYYLHTTVTHRAVRWSIRLMMVLCGVAVLGSYSRGAFLAAAAMVVFLLWKSGRRLALLLPMLVLVPVLLAFMPEKWTARMETVETYQQDSSAMARLNAWATMVNIANDRPLVGGGFDVAEPSVFEVYSPDPARRAQVAHSIYFQALGEHGYVGLVLYLLLLLSLWRKAGAVVRMGRDREESRWAVNLALMMQVTFVGFGVGGAFLSLVNYDVPYYLAGIVAATLALVERERRRAGSNEPAPVQAAASERTRLEGAGT